MFHAAFTVDQHWTRIFHSAFTIDQHWTYTFYAAFTVDRHWTHIFYAAVCHGFSVFTFIKWHCIDSWLIKHFSAPIAIQ